MRPICDVCGETIAEGQPFTVVAGGINGAYHDDKAHCISPREARARLLAEARKFVDPRDARIAALEAEVAAWQSAGQAVADLLDPLRPRVSPPLLLCAVRGMKAANASLRSERDAQHAWAADYLNQRDHARFVSAGWRRLAALNHVRWLSSVDERADMEGERDAAVAAVEGLRSKATAMERKARGDCPVCGSNSTVKGVTVRKCLGCEAVTNLED